MGEETFAALWRELDEVREAKGWTRERLARRVGALSGRERSPKTVHDRMSNGRRVAWAEARWFVEALDLNLDEWHARWNLAETHRRETPPALTPPPERRLTPPPEAEPVPPRDRVSASPRRRGLLALAVLGVAAAAYAAWPSGHPAEPEGCHPARHYRVTAHGNVVNDEGRGFDDVEPGDDFLRADPTGPTRLAGRYHGTITGRDVTGWVRIGKLTYDRTAHVCPPR